VSHTEEAGETHGDRGGSETTLNLGYGLKRLRTIVAAGGGGVAFCVGSKNFGPTHHKVSPGCLNGESGKPVIM
jgi:hypothetical protein